MNPAELHGAFHDMISQFVDIQMLLLIAQEKVERRDGADRRDLDMEHVEGLTAMLVIRLDTLMVHLQRENNRAIALCEAASILQAARVSI